MYVTRINDQLCIRDEKGRIAEFGEGDFRVVTKSDEISEILVAKNDSLQSRTLQSLISQSTYIRKERGAQVVYMGRDIEGWNKVLNVAARHGHDLDLIQLQAILVAVQPNGLKVTGYNAYKFIKILQSLTPGAHTPHALPMPEPTNREVDEFAVTKEVHGDTISISVPKGDIAGHFIGRKGANLSHLKEVLSAAGIQVRLVVKEGSTDQTPAKRLRLFDLVASA